MSIFYLPDLGEGLAEAEIREWYVKVGDVVKVDQPLVSMETAKAVVDVPSPYAGKITALHGEVNDIIKTGAPLITYESDKIPDKGSVVGKLETSEQAWQENEIKVNETNIKSIKALPAARLLAKEMNVDLTQVTPTGAQGFITPEDVKKCIAHSSTTKKSWEGSAETLHGVRRTMAQIMAQAHAEVAAVTIFEEADISHLSSKTDMTVHVLKSIVAAAQAEPALNAWFDGKTLERKLWDEVHIGIAVDTPEGLFVPVIKNVQDQSEQALRERINTYKETIKSRKISPQDLHGATITLSNFGMIAGRYATPIVVPPMVAIIGCGQSRDAVLVRDGQTVIGRILPISLTFDHRAATGAEAARFLNILIKSLSGSSL
jgi:2-oxoisovalerate dehydrogenase E2 component (dihydrolipoyl transacylase)